MKYDNKKLWVNLPNPYADIPNKIIDDTEKKGYWVTNIISYNNKGNKFVLLVDGK